MKGFRVQASGLRAFHLRDLVRAFAVSRALPLLLLLPTVATAAEPAATDRETLTRLPHVTFITRQHDGSAYSNSFDGVFFSDGDPRRWTEVTGPPDEGLVWSWGGDRSRLFLSLERRPDVTASTDDVFVGRLADVEPLPLLAVDVGAKPAIVRRELPPSAGSVAFGSKTAGVAVPAPMGNSGSHLFLTIDAGATWKLTPPLLPKRKPLPRPSYPAGVMPAPTAAPGSAPVLLPQPILHLLWVSPTRLVVSGSPSSVALFELHDDQLRQVWLVDLPFGAHLLAPDGDFVWVVVSTGWSGGPFPLYRLHLADGRIDAKIEPRSFVEGLAVCHGALITWDRGVLARNTQGTPRFVEPEALSIWTRDAGHDYVCRARLGTRYLDINAGAVGGHVRGVLPLQSPRCLVISGKGAGFVLDLEKHTLSSTPLEVALAPPAPPGSWAESQQTARTMDALMWRVPRPERDAVSAEWLKKTDMSVSDRNRWAIREFRRYIDTNKPRVLDLPGASDDHLSHIVGLDRIEYLYLLGSHITDAGLAHLAGAARLRELDLGGARITDAGLVHLEGLTQLRWLNLDRTGVTDDGLRRLRRHLPNCRFGQPSHEQLPQPLNPEPRTPNPEPYTPAP